MSELKTYYGLTLDPLHVGAGGYRLGRVDLTIIRDPGDNLPKVPGSSISGVSRNYAIYGLTQGKDDAWQCASEENKKTRGNCGKCIICKTYGYASGEKRENEPANQMGLVRFYDGLLTAFPVATMAGPVWVTTAEILRRAGADDVPEPGPEQLSANFEPPDNRLNLGWLFLPCEKRDFKLPSIFTQAPVLKKMADKIVIAPDYLFPEIVNTNLEVRTSVKIDFRTGAAENKALFTYEAIPRAALLSFDVVVDVDRCTDAFPAEKVRQVVNGGLQRFESLGLGGMNTRGFGRMKVINLVN